MCYFERERLQQEEPQEAEPEFIAGGKVARKQLQLRCSKLPVKMREHTCS